MLVSGSMSMSQQPRSMVAEDKVRSLALQAVTDLVAAQTQDVEAIEGNIALLQGHMATLLESFSTPIFPPGFEPNGAADYRQSSGGALQCTQDVSGVDKSLSLIDLAVSTGLPTKEAGYVDGSPDNRSAEKLSALPSPTDIDRSLNLSLDPIVAQGASGLAVGPSSQDNAGNRGVELRTTCVSKGNHSGSIEGKDKLLTLEQVQTGSPELSKIVGAPNSEESNALQEAGSGGWASKLTWVEIATRVTTESPETVFDWSILGEQGVSQNTEEHIALESFFQTLLKPHSKSARQFSFDDLENYKGMFQWLVVEEAKAVYEGGNCSLAWNEDQPKHTWTMQETLRPPGCLFCTLRLDPLQLDQNVPGHLSCFKVNDVVLLLSRISRQTKWVAIVDIVEEEYIGLRMRLGCDLSLNQQCVILRMPNLTSLRRMYVAVSRASWIYRPLLQHLLRPGAPSEEPGIIPHEHSFLRSWASLKFLDDSQLCAVAALLKMQHGFLLIQGGPGTGKTTVIVGMVSALLVHDANTRILVCAPSSTAVKNIYLGLMHGIVDKAGKAISPSSDILHLLCETESGMSSNCNAFDAHTQLLALQSASVVCTTLSECGGLQAPVHFDVAIIDDAYQAVEAEAIMALRPGVKRSVLVGDPQQLQSKVHQKPSTVFERSLFERLQDGGMPVHLLKAQYRMHPIIASFPFYQFYGISVLNGKRFVEGIYTCNAGDIGTWSHGYRIRPSEYCFLDVDPIASYSKHDAKEPRIIVAVVEAVILSLKPGIRPNIGVIPSSSEDVIAIAIELQKFGVSEAECEVNIVEGFQGREKDVIVLSCLRQHGGASSIFSDDRMLNVALTRAKHSLIIVGHSSSLQCRSWTWGALLEDIKKRGGYQALCEELKGSHSSKRNVEETEVSSGTTCQEGCQSEFGEKIAKSQDAMKGKHERIEECAADGTKLPCQIDRKTEGLKMIEIREEEGLDLVREWNIGKGNMEGNDKKQSLASEVNVQTFAGEVGGSGKTVEHQVMDGVVLIGGEDRRINKVDELPEVDLLLTKGESNKEERPSSKNKYVEEDLQRFRKDQELVEQEHSENKGVDKRRERKHRKEMAVNVLETSQMRTPTDLRDVQGLDLQFQNAQRISKHEKHRQKDRPKDTVLKEKKEKERQEEENCVSLDSSEMQRPMKQKVRDENKDKDKVDEKKRNTQEGKCILPYESSVMKGPTKVREGTKGEFQNDKKKKRKHKRKTILPDESLELKRPMKEKARKDKGKEQQPGEVEVQNRKGMSKERRQKDSIIKVNMLKEVQQDCATGVNAEKKKDKVRGNEDQPAGRSRKKQILNEDEPEARIKRKRKEESEEESDSTKRKRRKKEKQQELEETGKTRGKKSKIEEFQMDSIQEQEETGRMRGKKSKIKEFQMDSILHQQEQEAGKMRGKRSKIKEFQMDSIPHQQEQEETGKTRGKKCKIKEFQMDSILHQQEQEAGKMRGKRNKIKEFQMDSIPHQQEQEETGKTRGKKSKIKGVRVDSTERCQQEQQDPTGRTRVKKSKVKESQVDRVEQLVDHNQQAELVTRVKTKVKGSKLAAGQLLGEDDGAIGRTGKATEKKLGTGEELADASVMMKGCQDEVGNFLEKRKSTRDKMRAHDVVGKIRGGNGKVKKVKKVKMAAAAAAAAQQMEEDVGEDKARLTGSSKERSRWNKRDVRTYADSGDTGNKVQFAQDNPSGGLLEEKKDKTGDAKVVAGSMKIKVRRLKVAAVDNGKSKFKREKLAASGDADHTVLGQDGVDNLVGQRTTSKLAKGMKDFPDKMVQDSVKTKGKKSRLAVDQLLGEAVGELEAQATTDTKKASRKGKRSQPSSDSDKIESMPYAHTDKAAGEEWTSKRTSRKDDNLGKLVVNSGKANVKKSKSAASKRSSGNDGEIKNSQKKKRITKINSCDVDDTVRMRLVQHDKGGSKHRKRKVGEVRSETKESDLEVSTSVKKRKRHDETEPQLVGDRRAKKISKHRVEQEDDVQQGSVFDGASNRFTTEKEQVGNSQWNLHRAAHRSDMDALSLEVAKKAAAAAFWQSLIECKRP